MTDITDDTPAELVTQSGTCNTDGCGNAGRAITLEVPEGAQWVCGACGEPITDVT